MTNDQDQNALITLAEANGLYWGNRSQMWVWRRQNDDPNFPTIFQFSERGRRYIRRADAIAYRDLHRVETGEAA